MNHIDSIISYLPSCIIDLKERIWFPNGDFDCEGERVVGKRFLVPHPGPLIEHEYPPGEGGYEYPPEYYQQGYSELTPEYFEALQGEATLWKERFFYLY